MINLFALCLVFTSLLTAQLYSPNPTPKQHSGNHHKEEDVIVKEGHRVIVVETYDEHGQPNTKVSISPPQDPVSTTDTASGFVGKTKEKLKQARNVLPNIGQGISPDYHDQDQPRTGGSGGERRGPGELICDAFGKCTHKIARVIGKAKDQVSEKAQEVVAEEEEMARQAKEAAQDVIHREKKMAHEVKEKAEDAYEKVKDMASQKAYETKEAVENAYEKTKEFAAQKGHDTKEAAKESLSKDAAKSAKDKGKAIGKDAAATVSEQVEKAKESTDKRTNSICRFFNHSISYMGSTEGIDYLMGVINLLGFATAYGMCVWVTFISSHVLAVALTRPQFGVVQSKIYPIYFRAMAYCIGVALLGHLVAHRKLFSTGNAEMLQVYNLLTSILAVLINALYLEPLATKVMFEKLKIEKEEGRGIESLAAEASRPEQQLQQQPRTDIPAATATDGAAATAAVQESPGKQEFRSKMVRMNQRLKRLNSYSSFLNILTLVALTWHSVYLGQCLHGSC